MIMDMDAIDEEEEEERFKNFALNPFSIAEFGIMCDTLWAGHAFDDDWPGHAFDDDWPSEAYPDDGSDEVPPDRLLSISVPLYAYENEPADVEFHERESDEAESDYEDYENFEFAEDTDADEPFCSLKSLCTTELRMASTENVTVSKEHTDKKISCRVCLEDLCETEKAKCLPCRHFYHEECIHQWFRMNGSCPLCRKSVADF